MPTKYDYFKREEFKEWLSTESGLREETQSSYLSNIGRFFEEQSGFEQEISKAVDRNVNIEDVFSNIESVISQSSINPEKLSDIRSGLNYYADFMRDKYGPSDYESIYPMILSSDYINARFRHRILTQDRLGHDVYLPMRVFAKLFTGKKDTFLNDWVCRQVGNVTILHGATSKDFRQMATIKEIRIEKEGAVYATCDKGELMRVYTKRADDSLPAIQMNVPAFSRIVLDHVKPMSAILSESIGEFSFLPKLKERVDKEGKRTDRKVTTTMTMVELSRELLDNGELAAGDDFENLKDDLNIIGDKIQLQLMTHEENARKSDNA